MSSAAARRAARNQQNRTAWELAVQAQDDPRLITGGIVKGWLRNTTVGAISSWTDVMNASNSATQGTGSNQPTGNADGSITPDGVDDFLVWPTAAGINNATTQQGFACWIKPTSFTGFHCYLSCDNGVGASSRYGLYNNGGASGGLRFDVRDAAGATRHYDTAASVLTLNTAAFLTIEMPLAAADDITLTIGGVVKTLTVSSGSAITALRTSSLDHRFFGRPDTSLPSKAVFGRNFWPLQGVMAGAAAGRMLTAAATTALKNFEPLS